ncbi:MAG: cupin domain-containing protein [Bacteroidales bacterium]|nr:cupin domain-containing protein [Bacteroidales bacterium]
MNNKDSKYWIEKLQLQRHPEGGYFKEIYRSDEIIKKESLPERYSDERNFSTSIYFLLEKNDVSLFHRLKSDEIWHFYSGTSLTLYIIDKNGFLKKIVVGDNPDNEEVLQTVIKNGNWFAAKVNNPDSYSLIGCTVSPGFSFNDFELAKREDLIKLFPDHSDIIKMFTK